MFYCGESRAAFVPSLWLQLPQKGMQGGLVTGLEATTTINRADFNFGSKYPNAVVSDDVKITPDIEMDQN